eukprot:gene15350-biopygen3675
MGPTAVQTHVPTFPAVFSQYAIPAFARRMHVAQKWCKPTLPCHESSPLSTLLPIDPCTSNTFCKVTACRIGATATVWRRPRRAVTAATGERAAAASRTEQSRAEQSRAEQSRAEHSNTG